MDNLIYYKNVDFSKIEYSTIRTNKGVEYINLESAFDIETTSTYIGGEKVAFMYFWAFGFSNDGYVVYGRTWQEYTEFVGMVEEHFQLHEERVLITYVHNLGFEFQFMRKYFEWVNVFSMDVRKPLKALSNNGIEYRDSLILSGFSLAKTAENLTSHTIEKLDGDLDYSKIRHSKTKIYPKELGYIKHDILIILYYINEQIEQYGDITKIPLTNTGRVRKFVRHNCYYTDKNHRKSSRAKFQKYRGLMLDLQVQSTDEYHQLKRAFQGGFTHANAEYSGRTLEDVSSIDFTSSYPAVMLAEKFPMSEAIETTAEEIKEKGFDFYLDKYCLLFDVKFTNIQSKISFENYISESKAYSIKNSIINNGRIYSADELSTTITDIDFRIIKQVYKWDDMEIANVKRYHRGYLPKAIIESIIELYKGKTELKNVDGQEVEYVVSKGMLNSIYGMTVTDIIRDDITYSDDWGFEPADVEEQLEKYNTGHSRFLYYPWGVWVTAYARKNLWTGILNIADDYVYSDTDSIKLLNYEKYKPFIDWYDSDLTRKLHEMCEFHRLDFESLQPKDHTGKKALIGVWDYEGTFKRFKTLGAKRYLEETYDGDIYLTVAGLSKMKGINYMKEQAGTNEKVFELFNDDLYIPKDRTGKMTHTYIDTENYFDMIDYEGNVSHVNTLGGVHLENVDFTLNISKQYAEFINNLRAGYTFKGVEEIG